MKYSVWLIKCAVISAVLSCVSFGSLSASDDFSGEEGNTVLSHTVVLDEGSWEYTGEDEFDIAE